MNRHIARLTGLAMAAIACAAQAADAEVNLFISPAGQPFTAPRADPYPIVAWFKAADKNADGKLDKAEHRADAEDFFAVLDRNKDGFVAGVEVTIYERLIAPGILAVGPREGSGGPRERLQSKEGAVTFSLFREPQPVRAADRNFDYRVSLQEFRDHADRHFVALDTDGDGMLALADLPQTDAERAGKARRVPR